MSFLSEEPEVLVVGAGPVGLTLAVDLLRRGVRIRIVSAADQVFPGSRAKGIQPRTQEVFDDLGAARWAARAAQELRASGETARRRTRIVEEVDKQGRSGPLRFVAVRHEVSQGGRLAIAEEQDIVYRRPAGDLPGGSGGQLPDRGPALTLDVDERLLFRFSALTYNAHRIHYDREWCRREGYADLVVHGPLQALMMGELARRHGVSLVGRRFAYRLVSPMVGPQAMHVLPSEEGMAAGATVCTGEGRVTALSTLERL